MGCHISNDMPIVSFTNGELPKYVTPTITTVSQHGNHIEQTAANMLMQRLSNEDDSKPFTKKVIKTNLIKHESTRHVL